MTRRGRAGMLSRLMIWFLLGLVLGVLLILPLARLATRKTERRVRRLEARARAAERLAELGRLTGGLAHEIKNPLSTVGLNLQLLQEDLRELGSETGLGAPDEECIGRVRRRVDALAREAQRLRDILEDFLRFAGRIRLDIAPTDVNQLVSELVDFFAPQAQSARLRLRTQLDAAPAQAEVDASLVKQALLNLLINAVQAMTAARDRQAAGVAGMPGVRGGSGAAQAHGGGEELIIRTERRRLAGDRNTGESPDEIHIHVIDTGPGIPPERLEEIFQPYFSTKKGGTGLGLPTSRRIIEEHGGSLTVHSEPGRGSDFTIQLPVNSPQRPETPEESRG